MKKLLIALLAMTLCVPLAACSTKQPAEGSESSSEESVAEESSEPTLPEPTYTVPEKGPINVYRAFEEKTITLSNGADASFRIFVPEGYVEGAKYPLILFLHGAGERGSDNRAQLINATQNMFNDITSPVYGAIVIAPQCPLNKQWVNSSWVPGKYDLDATPESDEMKMAMEIMAWTEQTYGVDESRRYVMGISMGGFGTWDALLRHGDKFAGAVIMCGGGGDPTKVETIKDIPIYLVHSSDDTAVAFAGAKETVDALNKIGGGKLIFQKLSGFGHGVWNYTSENKLVMRWLLSQVKPAPEATGESSEPTETTAE